MVSIQIVHSVTPSSPAKCLLTLATAKVLETIFDTESLILLFFLKIRSRLVASFWIGCLLCENAICLGATTYFFRICFLVDLAGARLCISLLL